MTWKKAAPLSENPSAVNHGAVSINKLNKNLFITEKSNHSNHARAREDRIDLIENSPDVTCVVLERTKNVVNILAVQLEITALNNFVRHFTTVYTNGRRTGANNVNISELCADENFCVSQIARRCGRVVDTERRIWQGLFEHFARNYTPTAVIRTAARYVTYRVIAIGVERVVGKHWLRSSCAQAQRRWHRQHTRLPDNHALQLA